jgi:hypothetical protein
MAQDGREAKMAENEAIFRDANERIESRAAELDFEASVPFLCECADPACRELIRLSREEYADVRAAPDRFAVVPAHLDVVREGGGIVLEEREGYAVVAKTGIGAEIAEERDPRSRA